MNPKMTYLHFQYYNDDSFNHRYYVGEFDKIIEVLNDLLSEDLPNPSFEFTSVPFKDIYSGRYVKIL